MAYSIRNQFHTSLASTVLTDIQFQRENYYYFLGKVNTWGTGDTPSGTNPPLDESTDKSVRDNIAFFKKINANDVSLMCSRHEWVSGTVYDQWDHTQQMDGLPFYVVTPSNMVFKCLFNNHGAASTVAPANLSYNAFTTADGYIWQYMYTVPAFKNTKFTTPVLMPVQNALTDGFYNTGAVDSVVVNNQGSGYTDQLVTFIAISAAQGSGAVLVPKINHSTGSIEGVIVVNGGINYDSAYPPALSVQVMSGYTPGTNLYWENNNIGTALLVPIVSQGEIVSVMIGDPGQNYPHSNSTTISVTGDGSGLVVTPVVYQGKVIDTIIENPGTGYSFAHLTVNGAGANASLSAMFASSDFISDQSVVEQSATDGAIYAANILNGGSGYTATTQVIFSGDGAGATGTVDIVDGVITGINMVSYGAGYNYVDITFSDVNRVVAGNTEATAYAILPPSGGHGADAVKELYGRTLAVVNPIKVDPLTTNFNQDYRQYGIIKKPRNVFTNVPATLGFDSNTYQVTFNSVSGLAVDQILTLNTEHRYMVIYISGLTVWLQPLHNKLIDPVGSLIRGTNTYTASNVVNRPTINKYSGDLLYASDELPFTFSESQGLTIKTYITF